jgi:ATP-dependent DNA ligase
MLRFVKEQGLEGIIAKRADSVYQPGLRTGLWSKYRINLGQELVVGGYIPSELGVDSLVIGFYRDGELIYAGRVRAGFIPTVRRSVYEQIQHLVMKKCPFKNLPEKGKSRWGEGLNEEKMKECVWIKPKIVAQIEFLEWTGGDHLRHTKFIGLRDDKDPQKVVREIS